MLLRGKKKDIIMGRNIRAKTHIFQIARQMKCKWGHVVSVSSSYVTYLELKSFNNYGKAAMKEMKVHPDTFMQIAIQVSGFRTKGR